MEELELHGVAEQHPLAAASSRVPSVPQASRPDSPSRTTGTAVSSAPTSSAATTTYLGSRASSTGTSTSIEFSLHGGSHRRYLGCLPTRPSYSSLDGVSAGGGREGDEEGRRDARQEIEEILSGSVHQCKPCPQNPTTRLQLVPLQATPSYRARSIIIGIPTMQPQPWKCAVTSQDRSSGEEYNRRKKVLMQPGSGKGSRRLARSLRRKNLGT